MRFAHALVAAAGFILASCAPPMKEFTSDAPKETKVEAVRVTYDVPFAGDELYITDRSARGLDNFLATVGLDQQDHVYVIDRDIASPWSVQRAESVRDHLNRRQVAAEPGRAAPNVPARPDTVTVVVERYVVAALNCPDWTQPVGSNPENATHRNLGCAGAINLGQMVVDKRDIALGRTLGLADGDPAARAIFQYRRDVQKPLEQLDISAIASGGQQQQAPPAAPGAAP